ncbi:hypothetical protein SNEBB_010409 [Seison nebaliae]|nr:hypothetical protein SNEBB_010409 [Seison nebaliae]
MSLTSDQNSSISEDHVAKFKENITEGHSGKAIEYFQEHKILSTLEEILNCTFYDQPNDILAHIAHYLLRECNPPIIREQIVQLELIGHNKYGLSFLTNVEYRNQVKRHGPIIIPIEGVIEQSEGGEEGLKKMMTEIHETLVQDWIPTLQDEIINEERLSEKIKILYENGKDNEEKKYNLYSQTHKHISRQEKDGQTTNKRSKRASAQRVASAVVQEIEEDKPIACHRMSTCYGAITRYFTLLNNSFSEHQNLGPQPLYETLHGQYLKLTEEPEDLDEEKPSLYMPTPVLTLMKINPFCKLRIFSEILLLFSNTTLTENILMSCVSIHKALQNKDNIKLTDDFTLEITADSISVLLETINNILVTLDATNCPKLGLVCSNYRAFDPITQRYEQYMGSWKSADEMINFYRTLVDQYPQIKLLINPLNAFHKNKWTELAVLLSPKVYIVQENKQKTNQEINGSIFGMSFEKYQSFIGKELPGTASSPDKSNGNDQQSSEKVASVKTNEVEVEAEHFKANQHLAQNMMMVQQLLDQTTDDTIRSIIKWRKFFEEMNLIRMEKLETFKEKVIGMESSAVAAHSTTLESQLLNCSEIFDVHFMANLSTGDNQCSFWADLSVALQLHFIRIQGGLLKDGTLSFLKRLVQIRLELSMNGRLTQMIDDRYSDNLELVKNAITIYEQKNPMVVNPQPAITKKRQVKSSAQKTTLDKPNFDHWKSLKITDDIFNFMPRIR